MAEPFDSNDPGDEGWRFAQYYHVQAAEDLYNGEAVTINSSGHATRVSANGSDSVDGVVYNQPASGSQTTIKVSGSHIARVEPDVSAGDTCGTHDGSAENVDAGELSVNGSDYVALEVGTKTDPRDGNNEDYALVVKR